MIIITKDMVIYNMIGCIFFEIIIAEYVFKGRWIDIFWVILHNFFNFI